MTPFNPLVVFTLLHLSLTALGQQISLVTPSVAQCAQVPIHWNGGVGPFSVLISTTDAANFSSVEDTPVVQSSPYTWDEDLPAGTPFTISVTDNSGNSAVTPTITVLDSKNTSCLPNVSDVPPEVSSHNHKGTPLNTLPSTPTSMSLSQSISPSASSSPRNSSRSNSHVPVIIGVVIGVLAFFAVAAVTITLQRRKDRRQSRNSRIDVVKKYGGGKIDLDGVPDDDEEMAIPEPYVYKTVSRARKTSLAPLQTEDLRRNPSSTRHSSADSLNTSSHASLPSRKGERYLPNVANAPQDSGAGGSSQSRIQEEDIDRLAARMVAMMSAGRLADQSWTPEAGEPRNKGSDPGSDLQVPPPLYKDVTRRGSGGQYPSGGRY